MFKIAILLIVAGASLAFAQPAPPAPKPDPKPDVKVGDKADKLGQGGERPWARGVSPEQQETAIRIFAEGNGYLNDGIFPKAVETYREALKSWDHPAIHYNMALALTKLDRPIEVEQHLTKAIEHGPEPLETADKFEHAKEYLVLNAKLLAWIDVSCDKVGAKVSIDSKEVFVVTPGKPNRYEGRVTVGKHTVVAEKTGYNAQVDATYIEPGQRFKIELKLYTSDELRRYKRRWNARWMPYAVIGGGVLVAGSAALVQRSAQNSYDDYDAQIARCNADSQGNGCEISTQLTDLKSSGDTKRALGFVGFGLAGGAVIAGAVLLYLNRETSYEITADQYRKELATKPPAVSVVPVIGPSAAGAMLEGRF